MALTGAKGKAGEVAEALFLPANAIVIAQELLPSQLSAFDPAVIPAPEGCEVVFACRSGRRSVTASLAAQEQGYPYGAHLAGGSSGP